MTLRPNCFIVLGILFPLTMNTAIADQPLMDADILMMSRASGELLAQSGYFEKGIEAESKALTIAQDQEGPLSPSLVPILNDLATFQRYAGQYRKAEQNYKWGLAIREKILGPEQPEVAESLDLLAGLEVDLGHYSQAEFHYKQAFDVQKNAKVTVPLAVAATLEGLGNLRIFLGRGKEAADDLDQCLQIRSKEWGKEDLKLIPLWEELAQAHIRMGDFDAAEVYYQKGLSLRQAKLGPDRPEITDSLEKLADFYRIWGKLDKADPLWKQVAENRNRFSNNNDFPALPMLYSAALADFALKRWKESEALLERVLALRKKFYGPNHPLVALGLEDLASLAYAQGQQSKAIDEQREAVGILEGELGPDHLFVLKGKTRLADFSR